MCIFILITLAGTVAATPQDCDDYCQSLSPSGPSLSWCNCSLEVLAANAPSEAPSITDSSQHEETDIYYEPDDTQVTFKTRLLFQQPFFVKTPTSYLKSKMPKREVENNKALEPADNSTIEINKKISTPDQPLYLDIGVENSVKSREAVEIDDVEPTEKSLVECLDLHIVVFSRGGVNTTIPSQLVRPETLEKYATMSDADVILAIKTKCTQPLDIVNRSLQKIQRAQPKKKGISSNTFHNGSIDIPLDSDLQSLTNSVDNSSLGENDNISNDTFLDLSDTGSDVHISKVTNATTTLTSFLNSSTGNVTDSDNCTTENKILSTRSTVGISSTGIFDTDYTFKSNDIVQDRSLNINQEITSTDAIIVPSTSNEATDANVNTDFNGTFIDGYESTDSLSPQESVPETVTSDDSESQASEVLNEYATTLVDTENYSVKSSETTFEPVVDSTTAIEFIAESTDKDTATYDPANDEDESIVNERSTHPLTTQEEISTPQPFDITQDNISKENYYNFRRSEDTKIGVRHHHQILRESEIMIPRILTKELANGSVVSFVHGYELLPNGDFTVNVEESYEDTSTAEDPQIYSRRGFESTTTPDTGISGNMYFVFDKALIPARFLQHSDGVLTLGLNGNSMCQNFLKNHRNRSPFLLKLCKAVIDDKYDDIQNVEK